MQALFCSMKCYNYTAVSILISLIKFNCTVPGKHILPGSDANDGL